jgi:hypothetical protein
VCRCLGNSFLDAFYLVILKIEEPLGERHRTSTTPFASPWNQTFSFFALALQYSEVSKLQDEKCSRESCMESLVRDTKFLPRVIALQLFASPTPGIRISLPLRYLYGIPRFQSRETNPAGPSAVQANLVKYTTDSSLEASLHNDSSHQFVEQSQSFCS